MKALSGLRPLGLLCLGPGFSREEAKELLLEAGYAFQSRRIVSVEELAARGLGVDPERILDRISCEEAIRDLMGVPRVYVHFPELRSLSRRRSGLQRIERALARGRMAFAHSEERHVLEERVGDRDPVSVELSAFSAVWEAYLEGAELWDAPRLLERATQACRTDGVAFAAALEATQIEHWSLLGLSELEAREAAFWEALGESVEVARPAVHSDIQSGEWGWDRHHTWDDAAEALCRALAEVPAPARGEHVLLIEDVPEIRRSVLRALSAHGIELSDPRDPTHARRAEDLKAALLPLELEAGGYERLTVVRWIEHAHPERAAEWVDEIQCRGIRQGLRAYSGGKLHLLHAELTRLHERWGARRTAEDWASALVGGVLERPSRAVADTERTLGRAVKTRRAAWCLEKLRRRIELAPPPPAQVKPRSGFRLHRLGQARVPGGRSVPKQVWIFGIPADFMEPEAESDLWFTARMRERLSTEFQVRARGSLRLERLRAVQTWISGAGQIRVLDARHGSGGAELESIAPLLRVLSLGRCPESPVERGAHERYLPSLSADWPTPPSEVRLPAPASVGIDRMEATELDQWSRCGFKGLVSKRWRLPEIREAEIELWPDVRGTLLHAAVREVLCAKREGRVLTPRDALGRAWEQVPPRGLLGGKRVRGQVLRVLERVLEEFLEKERGHEEFARTQIESLDRELRLESVFDGTRVVGAPDRVDLHPDGRILTDYKSSSNLPQGSEMAEGYALQLPFYAVALREKTGQEVIGAQFVSLNRTASRARGIVFSKWNGSKTPGAAFKLMRTSRSLIASEPEEFWPRMRERIEEVARLWARGEFPVRPRFPKNDCPSCRAEDLCGIRRTQVERE